MTKNILIRVSLLLSLSLLPFVPIRAQISQKQARKLIASAAGMSLPSSAVRIEKVISSTSTSSDVAAELELVFRFERNRQRRWRLEELRTGEGRWENINSIVETLKLEDSQSNCYHSNQSGAVRAGSDLTTTNARCLIASLLSVPLPSDGVRIKSISGLSLGPRPSALAVSLVRADFRFSKSSSGWQLSGFHSGTRQWVNLEGLQTSIDAAKHSHTTQQMKVIASALEAFKRARGSFVISDKLSVLIDNLTPQYLHQVIRFDSWQQPFRYQGDREHFTLRSLGPDGKENTPDDIVVSR